MSSEELKDHLVDLLYDDELDDETRASMRREVESSDEAREELEQFESMLGMIRESTEDEGPSESVHESIMAAAREQAENATRERAAATERAPRVPSGDDEQGLWARISSHQVTQLALAACAILGAGFLFYLFNMQADESAPGGMASSQEAKFESASNEPSGPISLDDEEVAQAETEPPADKGAFDMEGESRSRGSAREREEAAEQPASTATDELAKAPRPGPRKKNLDDSVATTDKKAEAPAPKPSRRAKKSRPKLDTSKDKFDPFTGESDEAQNVFGSAESPKAKTQQRSRSTSGSASSSDNSGVVSSLGLSGGDSVQQEPEEEAAAPSAGAGAADMDAPSQEATAREDADRTSGTTVADVESAYRSGDNKMVVSRADDIINSPTTGSDEARALELKGFALRRMGQLEQADRTLARLQSEYPDYKSSTIQSARADIAQQLREQREAKRRKRRPAESDDEIEMMPESESMESAPTESTDEAY